MPRDNHGRWVPEPHRADGYGAGQVRSAADLLGAFGRSAADAPPPQADVKTARPVAAATTIQRVPTPFGDMRLGPNAQAQARNLAAERMAERHAMKVPRDVQRDWKARRMLKEFEKAKQRAHARETDLER